jgi:nucleoside-diphosphate-sugar epimerase
VKIFLAGATGTIGRLLVPLLVEAGHGVAGTTRRADKLGQIAAAGGRPVLADALDRGAVFAALEAERAEVVIHQLTDLSGRDFAANARLRVEGTRNLVDAALAVGVRRMIAQSIAWIYVPGPGPADEGEPLDLDAPPPRGETVAGVQALESAVAEVPIGVVLRYGLLYGPGTWYARDGLITDQVRRGEIEATEGVTSFLHIVDAAHAALAALAWPARPLNIVDDEPAAGTEWLPVYAGLVGAPAPQVRSGAAGWERGASNARARRLGWRPRYPSWREGFKRALGAGLPDGGSAGSMATP